MHGRNLLGGWQEWVDIDQLGAIGIIQERDNGGLDWGDRDGIENSRQMLELLTW